jgi:hypothetical protein
LSRIRVLYILSVSFEGDFKLENEKPCGSILINIDTTIRAQKRVIWKTNDLALLKNRNQQ